MICAVFPGQGAQSVGMGKDLYQNYEQSRIIFDKSGQVKEWCFSGTVDLSQTRYTQPAMLTASVAAYSVIKSKGVDIGAVAGFSLGEYAALCAAQVIGFEDCLSLVTKRGLWMEEAYPNGGGMMAVIGADIPLIENVVSRTLEKQPGVLEIVNYNCPGQTVLAGMECQVNAAADAFEALKIRVVKLDVSGPFHSSLMGDVKQKIADQLDVIPINKPAMPIMSNALGDYYSGETDEMKRLIAKQVCLPVKWQQSVEKLIEQGFDTFLELGAGKVLCGLIKKINRKVTALPVYDADSLEKAVNKIGDKSKGLYNL